MAEPRKVLDSDSIDTMILRMTYQIVEQFMDYEELVIIGIDGEGFSLAQKINNEIRRREELNTNLYRLILPKHESKKPEINFEPSLPDISGKPVLLVDDVLNSGRTLSYCIRPILEYAIPSLKIAVLIKRTYRQFPISASITGISLSTTYEENVIAKLSGPEENIGVFLS